LTMHGGKVGGYAKLRNSGAKLKLKRGGLYSRIITHDRSHREESKLGTSGTLTTCATGVTRGTPGTGRPIIAKWLLIAKAPGLVKTWNFP
jgi:hypothetical protein